MKPSARLIALNLLQAVIDQGESLSSATPRLLPKLADSRDRAFAYRLVLDSLRHLNQFAWYRDQLLETPLKARDQDVALLLVLGIAQLLSKDLPEHASLHETVEVAKRLKKKWAIALVNGVLRNFQRQQDGLLAKMSHEPSLYFSHPSWLIKQWQQAYPQHWQQLCQANNTPARLCIRLSPHIDRSNYLTALDVSLTAEPHPYLDDAILLDSTDVTQLPGFADGDFIVQDAHAQLAARLLAPTASEKLLDACAAPGGKTIHLIHLAGGSADITALDVDALRLKRIEENLDRLQLRAKLITADASQPDSWWDGEQYDAILLDAPCSATGIIRRHPDIKWHRKPHDIQPLTEIQALLLDRLWPLVKPGGRLLYSTCSVLPAENSLQIRAFLERTQTATLQRIDIPHAIDTEYGLQCLPQSANSGDGFFYAYLQKTLP